LGVGEGQNERKAGGGFPPKGIKHVGKSGRTERQRSPQKTTGLIGKHLLVERVGGVPWVGGQRGLWLVGPWATGVGEPHGGKGGGGQWYFRDTPKKKPKATMLSKTPREFGKIEHG